MKTIETIKTNGVSTNRIIKRIKTNKTIKTTTGKM